jgi:hypothetical protein
METPSIPQIGRNEPCPCGSGKKYKRCCGADAAPKLSTPVANPAAMGLPGAAGGFDPSQFDPKMMQQFSQMLGRLPKGQIQKLQGLMQRAMAGKDVTREAKEFEQSLPLDMQSMLSGLQMPGMPASVESTPVEASSDAPEMSEAEARAIVEAAAKEGKISDDQAQNLLKEPKGVSKLWKKISGK